MHDAATNTMQGSKETPRTRWEIEMALVRAGLTPGAAARWAQALVRDLAGRRAPERRAA